MKKLNIMRYQKLRFSGLAAFAVLSLGVTMASAQVDVAQPYPFPPPLAAHSPYATDSSRDLGFYLNGDLGSSFMPDFQSSRFGFPGNFRTDVGMRFSAQPGYNFLAARRLTLGGEFETGVIYNRISHVYDAGSPTPWRGEYYQVPLLGNLVLKCHASSRVVPYVGVGGGGDISWARIHSPGFRDFGGSSNDKFDPAAQGMAGVRFHLNSISDFGLGYKFLADFPSDGKYIATHSVVACFTVKF